MRLGIGPPSRAFFVVAVVAFSSAAEAGADRISAEADTMIPSPLAVFGETDALLDRKASFRLDHVGRKDPRFSAAYMGAVAEASTRTVLASMHGHTAIAPLSPVRFPLVAQAPRMTAGFFYAAYPAAWSPAAQHLGVDLAAPAGTFVVSPVTGTVLTNRTGVTDTFQKHLVIRDASTGFEHVLGHINSTLAPGTSVHVGMPVGIVVSAGTGPHVHWGVNTRGVQAAVDGRAGWGWGRAPVTSTREQAIERGWIDPLTLMASAIPAIVQQQSGPAATTQAQAIQQPGAYQPVVHTPWSVWQSDRIPGHQEVLDPRNGCRINAPTTQATSMRWNGACIGSMANGPGILDLFRGTDLILRMHIGPEYGIRVREGDLYYDLDMIPFVFSLTTCERRIGVVSRLVTIGLRRDVSYHYASLLFQNIFITRRLLYLGARFGLDTCFPGDEQFQSYPPTSVVITGRCGAVRCEEIAIGRGFDPRDQTWREEFHLPAQAFLLAAQAEVRQAQAAQLLQSSEPISNLSDFLRSNRAAAMQQLALGRQVIVQFRPDNFLDGKVISVDVHSSPAPASVFFLGGPPTVTAICQIDPAEARGMQEGHRYRVHARLVRLELDTIILDCSAPSRI
jgi:murein DD-endopeptidase MepM/ murein hydrolase activator NlpD